jgi:hypothetical protein
MTDAEIQAYEPDYPRRTVNTVPNGQEFSFRVRASPISTDNRNSTVPQTEGTVRPGWTDMVSNPLSGTVAVSFLRAHRGGYAGRPQRQGQKDIYERDTKLDEQETQTELVDADRFITLENTGTGLVVTRRGWVNQVLAKHKLEMLGVIVGDGSDSAACF